MKQRETRRKVMLRARVRAGASWQDACILNLSSRGLMIQSSTIPPRGTYLELRRGPFVIVARVMWADGRRCGLQSQERLAVDSIVRDLAADSVEAAAGSVERRRQPRGRPAAERSRERGRRLEFVGIAFAAVTGAVVIAGMVMDAMARPIAAVMAAL